jgi:hypothetical protein
MLPPGSDTPAEETHMVVLSEMIEALGNKLTGIISIIRNR